MALGHPGGGDWQNPFCMSGKTFLLGSVENGFFPTDQISNNTIP